MVGKEKERSADSLPHWLSDFLPKLPLCSLIWFYDLKYRLPHVWTAADHSGWRSSAVTNATEKTHTQSRNTEHPKKTNSNCTTEVPYSATCSVSSSLSPAQFKFNPLLWGWSTYLVEQSHLFCWFFFFMFCSSLVNPSLFFSCCLILDSTMLSCRVSACRKKYKLLHLLFACLIRVYQQTLIASFDNT